MKKIIVFLLFLVFVISSQGRSLFEPLPLSARERGEGAPQASEGWVAMPEGGKPAYMGIHGGTMPVSLLVSEDGSSLFSFVGRTGNDFLDTLRKAHEPLPSFGNSTRHKSGRLHFGPTELFAGNATASMPVISLSGDLLERQSWFGELQPFGLSQEPLSIEGQVSKPEWIPPARKYRLFFLPEFLQPRRK